MNIVIEGCDGTGKSTLAQFLASKLGLRYWHESSPRNYEQYKQMLEYGGVVYDRFCYGQFVYNKPEERLLTLDELKKLQTEVFPATSTIVLYVDLNSEEILKRIQQRGESLSIKEIKNIRGTYRELFRNAKTEYINLDGGNDLYGI